jgi:UDP-glucose 4-epimerase
VVIKKKILILGGYGFLGSKLYRSLKDNYYVFRYGKFSKKKEISLSTLKKIKKNFDIIIHSAGSSSVTESIVNPKKDLKKTVGSTRALIKFIKEKKIKPRLVFISSPAIFGDSIKKRIMQPISPYGRNKLKSEKLLKTFAKKNKLDLSIVRFFSLYGEGLKKQLLWDVLCKLKNNIFVFNGSGSEIRSWMHVSDAVKIINLVFKV